MARKIGRLSAVNVPRLTAPGMYADGGGLYLQIGKTGAKSWTFRYRANGRERYLGLGSVNAVPLKLARERAAEARLQRATGIDPLDARKAAVAKPAGKTFRQAADEYIAANESARTAKHNAQWTASLAAHAFPLIGDTPVADVDVAAVLRVLTPIWNDKPVTANRIRNRVELILDAAKARGWRAGENPARWRGHMDKILPAVRRIHRVDNLPAMPFEKVPAFMARIREAASLAAAALEFTILTATRTNESLGATRDEIAGDVWTIPAERMKARKQHKVPLVGRALDLAQDSKTDFLFRGRFAGDPLGLDAMRQLVRRLDCPYSVHGFRSAFKDWCTETTDYPDYLSEMALAHAIPSAVEAAYRRGDLLTKRRQLMADWEAFLMTGAT